AHEVMLVFSDLPQGFDSADKLKDKWVVFAGYFFKLTVEAPEGKIQGVPRKEWKKVPVLIGQSVRVLPNGPVPEGDRIEEVPNKTRRIFQLIRDDAPPAGGEEANWPEAAAHNWVCLYARKFPERDLQKHARKGLTFADLFLEGRHQYKLDLVHFEGTLKRLRV